MLLFKKKTTTLPTSAFMGKICFVCEACRALLNANQPSPRSYFILSLTIYIDKPATLSEEQEVAGVYFSSLI